MFSLEATASFACLGCHELHLNPKRWIPKNQQKVGKMLVFAILTKKMLHSEVAEHLLTSFVCNINRRMYITINFYSAHGHELSGRVCTHT